MFGVPVSRARVPPCLCRAAVGEARKAERPTEAIEDEEGKRRHGPAAVQEQTRQRRSLTVNWFQFSVPSGQVLMKETPPPGLGRENRDDIDKMLRFPVLSTKFPCLFREAFGKARVRREPQDERVEQADELTGRFAGFHPLTVLGATSILDNEDGWIPARVLPIGLLVSVENASRQDLGHAPTLGPGRQLRGEVSLSVLHVALDAETNVLRARPRKKPPV